MNRKLATALAALSGAASVAVAADAPPATTILQFQPKQAVAISTPAGAEIAACKAELYSGPAGPNSGWTLRDGRGQVLRRFYASRNPAVVDTYSYFLDGVEVYREIDTAGRKKPDQFRWYGPAGSRWGVDVNGDGRIDGWKQISAEEVSQELLQAVLTQDVARFQALLLNQQELLSLELGGAETSRLRESITNATTKFNQVAAALIRDGDKPNWLHLETAAPQCVPAEATGGKREITRYSNGTVLYDHTAKGAATKHDWLQTGEMVQVGAAWRLVDGPATGHATDSVARGGSGGGAIQVSDNIKEQLAKLQQIDARAPQPGSTPAQVVAYNRERARVLSEIVAVSKGEERDQWLKQVADCLGAAAQNSVANDRSALTELEALKAQATKAGGSQSLIGYIAFREISAEYANKLSGNVQPAEMGKIQDAWREKLAAFVTNYPTADDTPDALQQLGMVSEFVGKETDAKNWYAKLANDYRSHPLAAKAAGALRRLDLDGKPFELSAPTLGQGQPFDIRSLNGRAVIVYYWASWNAQFTSDFTKLQSLQGANKGLAVVCVNLDNDPTQAIRALQQVQQQAANMTHLFQAPGGLDSPLATQYGVMVLPNMFLIGPDNKCASRSVQISSIDEELKKLLSK